MNSVTVDELVMRIEIELDKFRSEAGQAEDIEKRLRRSLKGTEEAAKNAGEGMNDLAEDVAKSSRELSKQEKTLMQLVGRFTKFLTALSSPYLIQRFTAAIADANDQLGFMSKRLGMAARDIRGIETAVAALGGAGASATGTIRNLNQGIQEMVLMGNDSLIPFFGALGVGVVDASGGLRQMDDILLDMADSLSKMDPAQAYAVASAMGLDDGVANALIQGRDAMQEMLDMQKKISVSSAEEIRASRELSKAQAFLGAQWEGLKTILANAIIPLMVKLTKTVSGWVEYLSRNERGVKNFFEGVGIAISVILIPLLLKAGMAMLALVSPILGTAAVVGVLAAAFGVLYDDYKTWAEGGKSLFDWAEFDKYIKNTNVSVESLGKGFAKLLTGYNSIAEAQAAFMKWMRDTGIIDQNGFSIKGLGSAFKQLGRDIYAAIPALQTMVELIGAVMDGRWSDALSLAKKIPVKMAGTLMDAGSAMAGRVGGALDTALGKESSSGGSAAIVSGMIGQSGLTPPAEYAPMFKAAAAKHGVPEAAIIALAHQESRFNPNAVGPQTKWGKAKGMMQYLDSTAASLGISSSDPGQSIDAAAMQLRQRLDAGDSLEDAIKHHHAGPNKQLWGPKTDRYGSEVMSKASAISAQNMVRGGFSASPAGASGGAGGGASVTIGSISVQTSATTLPAATADGVAAGVSRSSELINQLGGGIQ